MARMTREQILASGAVADSAARKTAYQARLTRQMEWAGRAVVIGGGLLLYAVHQAFWLRLFESRPLPVVWLWSTSTLALGCLVRAWRAGLTGRRVLLLGACLLALALAVAIVLDNLALYVRLP